MSMNHILVILLKLSRNNLNDLFPLELFIHLFVMAKLSNLAISFSSILFIKPSNIDILCSIVGYNL